MAPRLSIQPRSWFVLLLAGGLAHAQESPILGLADETILFEEIPSVYGASKREQKTNEAPFPLASHRFTAGTEVQYVAPRLTLQGNTAGGYTVVNLTLFGPRVWKQVDLSASMYNLFAKRYFDPGTGNVIQDQIEQDGRAFLLKATCRF
jgi:outer membrane receptor protein involved in Fe transport